MGIGNWIGNDSYAEIIWAVALVAIFHVVLTRTRWGLHTIAAGGNQLGAREAGINVARIKYGNFMITGVLGAFVGLQIAFQTSVIDPSAGGYQPMFYAVAAAVIGGTAMLGGSGTIIGALLGSVMLAVLTDGFNVHRGQRLSARHHLRRGDPGRHDRQYPARAAARIREARMTVPDFGALGRQPAGQYAARRAARAEHISKRFGAVTALDRHQPASGARARSSA